MLSQFQASYQRVEASLQKLTDSIAAYNPSTSAAEELVVADEAVNRDVEQLITHQKNHLRILELRRTADALDEQIKNTIRMLADTRKEISSIPSVESDEPRREVKVDELLSYAKFISKTTVPPTLRKPLELPTRSAAVEKPQISNGMATPPQGTSQQEDNKDSTRAVKELGDLEKAWLMPQNLPFDPWPSGETMRMGALGRIQKMLEDGEDPAAVLSEEEKKEVERKRKEEEERQERETRKAREEWGYGGGGGGGRRGTVVDEPFNPDDF